MSETSTRKWHTQGASGVAATYALSMNLKNNTPMRRRKSLSDGMNTLAWMTAPPTLFGSPKTQLALDQAK